MMKSLSVAFGLLMALSSSNSVSAFAPVKPITQMTALRMSDSSVPEEPAVATINEPAVTETPLPEMSASLPFLARPAALTGALAGDVGFDPLGFAKSDSDLMNYREAEVKHARLAMLAAAGWPLSELFDKKIAAVLGMQPLLDNSDRVPSLLNGGLGKISPAYWVGCIGLAAMIDIFGTLKLKSSSDDYIPGDFGLRLGYPKDEEGKKSMQLAEIKNGRLAMMAIFGFAVQEFVSKQGVIVETPLFFYPINEAMHQYLNAGYIQ